jgi:hypothetical protein
MDSALAWDGNWAWSVRLIVVTVILHVIGPALINERLVQVKRIAAKGFDSILAFALVMGITTLLVTLLHAGEAGIWAAMYWILGGLPRREIGAVVFAGRNDHLRPPATLSCGPRAPDGCA